MWRHTLIGLRYKSQKVWKLWWIVKNALSHIAIMHIRWIKIVFWGFLGFFFFFVFLFWFFCFVWFFILFWVFFFASFIFCHLPRGTMNYNEKMLILYNKMLVLRKCCVRKVLSFNCILTFIPCWIFCINLNKKSRVNFLKISFKWCCIVLIISYWPRAFSYYHYQHTLSYNEFLFES